MISTPVSNTGGEKEKGKKKNKKRKVKKKRQTPFKAQSSLSFHFCLVQDTNSNLSEKQ